jgi:hypothetical protein
MNSTCGGFWPTGFQLVFAKPAMNTPRLDHSLLLVSSRAGFSEVFSGVYILRRCRFAERCVVDYIVPCGRPYSVEKGIRSIITLCSSIIKVADLGDGPWQFGMAPARVDISLLQHTATTLIITSASCPVAHAERNSGWAWSCSGPLIDGVDYSWAAFCSLLKVHSVLI